MKCEKFNFGDTKWKKICRTNRRKQKSQKFSHRNIISNLFLLSQKVFTFVCVLFDCGPAWALCSFCFYFSQKFVSFSKEFSFPFLICRIADIFSVDAVPFTCTYSYSYSTKTYVETFSTICYKVKVPKEMNMFTRKLHI